jgi:hypothetical protein
VQMRKQKQKTKQRQKRPQAARAMGPVEHSRVHSRCRQRDNILTRFL